jgi:hypothetical protein
MRGCTVTISPFSWKAKMDDAAFSQKQMQAHRARLQTTGHKPPKDFPTTWGQIHGFFDRLLPRLTDLPSAKLLVEQFIEFLEYTGMTEFNGFRPEHFRYFLLHDDDDARRWIRDQVGYFAAQVRASLYESTPFYEASDIGNLRLTDAYCWAAFGPRGNAYRKVTHQTISLASDGLRVFVNSELKAATDRLKHVLKQSNATFRTALQYLHAFELSSWSWRNAHSVRRAFTTTPPKYACILHCWMRPQATWRGPHSPKQSNGYLYLICEWSDSCRRRS